MKILPKIFYIIIIFTIISCAKQSTPMGGDKDEQSPELISIKPIHESTNIKPETIELFFNEFVKAETPNKLIIITPRINKDEMIVTANKNKIIIKLNQELEDSTTYVFNFQKSIQDITESNPAENLKLVFSTGNYIDSLKIAGNVSYIFPPRDQFIKDVLVGLYEVSDTTNVLTATPYYITATDSVGNFEITNIKAGQYRAYAWFDSNNNLKAEEKTEPYAFYSDTITIDQDIKNINLSISKSDISELKINRASSVGEYFDIVLSKIPTEIKINHVDSNKKIFYRLKEKNLRIYHKDLRNDSIQTSIVFKDSVGFILDTLMYLKFQESDRIKEKLETSVNSGNTFLNKINAIITFNKPITNINLDSLYITHDTASIIKIRREWIYLADSSDFTKINIDIPIIDTLKTDTYTLYIADSTFQDIEGKFNEKKLEAKYKKLDKTTLVTSLDITVDTEERPLLLQLLSKSGDKIIEEVYLKEDNKYSFKDFEAGTYHLRVIIDRNKNKKWDPSNMIQNRQAEKIYYYRNPNELNSYDIIVKGGWTNEIILITKYLHELTNEQTINTKDKVNDITEDMDIDNK